MPIEIYMDESRAIAHAEVSRLLRLNKLKPGQSGSLILTFVPGQGYWIDLCRAPFLLLEKISCVDGSPDCKLRLFSAANEAYEDWYWGSSFVQLDNYQIN